MTHEISCKATAEVYAQSPVHAKQFKAIHDLMWEINRTGGAKSPGSVLPLLVDPQIRKRIAQLIRQVAAHDRKAAEHLEAAVGRL